ncbi:MAG: hypothetical protein V2A78_01710 [bacterium]
MKRAFFLSAFLLFSMLGGVCQESRIAIKINFQGPSRPAISRHLGFTACIPAASLACIKKESLQFFVNGQNKTYCVRMELDPGSGDLYFSYKPDKPLPLGKVEQKIIGTTVADDVFTKSWMLVIDQEADPLLAPWARIIKSKPRNVNAHFQLARAYEQKYLLEDAVTEYREVLRLAPKHTRAQAAYVCIYGLWDRKSLNIGGITLDVSKDSGLEKMGYIVVFKVTLINRSGGSVRLDPKDALLIIDGETQEPPVSTWKGYPRKLLDTGLINIDDFARLEHYLDSHNIPLLEERELQAGVSTSGYLAFSTNGIPYKKLKLLIFAGPSRKKLEFAFPFIKP